MDLKLLSNPAIFALFNASVTVGLCLSRGFQDHEQPDYGIVQVEDCTLQGFKGMRLPTGMITDDHRLGPSRLQVDFLHEFSNKHNLHTDSLCDVAYPYDTSDPYSEKTLRLRTTSYNARIHDKEKRILAFSCMEVGYAALGQFDDFWSQLGRKVPEWFVKCQENETPTTQRMKVIDDVLQHQTGLGSGHEMPLREKGICKPTAEVQVAVESGERKCLEAPDEANNAFALGLTNTDTLTSTYEAVETSSLTDVEQTQETTAVVATSTDDEGQDLVAFDLKIEKTIRIIPFNPIAEITVLRLPTIIEDEHESTCPCLQPSTSSARPPICRCPHLASASEIDFTVARNAPVRLRVCATNIHAKRLWLRVKLFLKELMKGDNWPPKIN